MYHGNLMWIFPHSISDFNFHIIEYFRLNFHILKIVLKTLWKFNILKCFTKNFRHLRVSVHCQFFQKTKFFCSYVFHYPEFTPSKMIIRHMGHFFYISCFQSVDLCGIPQTLPQSVKILPRACSLNILSLEPVRL